MKKVMVPIESLTHHPHVYVIFLYYYSLDIGSGWKFYELRPNARIHSHLLGSRDFSDHAQTPHFGGACGSILLGHSGTEQCSAVHVVY